jgi:hypothetical protein
MALTQGRLLNSLRFNRIIGRLAAELDIVRPLNFLDRLPLVPAFDDELVGRFTGKIIAADIIADDQKAVVQESMTMDIVSHSAPNVKIGERVGQKMLNRLQQWQNGLFASVQGEDRLKEWDMQLAENLMLGVRERMNAMAAGMFMDSFSYGRFGVNIQNATWGMPSAFKITTSNAWSNASAGTPISDILTIDESTRLQFGIVFDNLDMSTANFIQMIATTEFANKATLMVGSAAAFLLTPAALRTAAVPEMKQLAERILGKTIVLDDTTYYEKNNDGSMTHQRAIPNNTVILSRKEDWGKGRAYDFGNGTVTESLVGDLMGGPSAVIGGWPGGSQYGPIGYLTQGSTDLNPPSVNAWAVARAFPRKYIPESSGVLKVG